MELFGLHQNKAMYKSFFKNVCVLCLETPDVRVSVDMYNHSFTSIDLLSQSLDLLLGQNTQPHNLKQRYILTHNYFPCQLALRQKLTWCRGIAVGNCSPHDNQEAKRKKKKEQEVIYTLPAHGPGDPSLLAKPHLLTVHSAAELTIGFLHHSV